MEGQDTYDMIDNLHYNTEELLSMLDEEELVNFLGEKNDLLEIGSDRYKNLMKIRKTLLRAIQMTQALIDELKASSSCQ